MGSKFGVRSPRADIESYSKLGSINRCWRGLHEPGLVHCRIELRMQENWRAVAGSFAAPVLPANVLTHALTSSLPSREPGCGRVGAAFSPFEWAGSVTCVADRLLAR